MDADHTETCTANHDGWTCIRPAGHSGWHMGQNGTAVKSWNDNGEIRMSSYEETR
jgi:hypothetical protein